MRFNAPDYVYRCSPPILGNDTAEEPFTISIKGIPAKDLDAAVIEQSVMTPDNRAKKSLEMIGKQVVDIENLWIGDVEIKTFKQLYELAPREIYSWVCAAVYSTEALSEAEVKN